jgi:hypothetical protein
MSALSAPAFRPTRRPWRAIHRATAPALAVVLLSGACRQASSRDASAPRSTAVASPAPPPADLAVAGAAPQPARLAQAEGAQRSGPSQPVDPVSYLAYAYTMALEVPGDRLPGVMDAHVAACRSAGLRLCQLVGSERDGDPASALRGSLSLRAEPAWLQRFMQGVQRDAASADGRVTGQTTTTEDLTRDIVDTEATLRAKRGLRDRLQQLLATRPGDLADLLSVERELARVQGEIDSTESNLAAMRTRVAMSALTIEYASTPRAVASGTFEPLRLAVLGFLVAVVESTAALVTVIGALLPWILVLWLLVWIALRVWRRRVSRQLAPAEAPSAQGGDTPVA